MSGRLDALDAAGRARLRAEGLGGLAAARGIAWGDLLAHGRVLAGFASAWLILVWIVPVLGHPRWILAFGALFALAAGRLLGGDEAAEGTEEYAFALPPTRRQRYLTRLALGGAPLLLFTAGGVAAIALDLPQRLWGLAVSSGMTEPFRPAEVLWYALAIAAPLAAFAVTFALAAQARSRGAAEAAWIGGALLTAGLAGAAWLGELTLRAELGLGFGADHAMAGVARGLPVAAVLAIAAVLAAVWGLGAYARKEGVSRPAPARGGAGRWVLIGLVLLLLLWVLASFVLFSRQGRDSGGMVAPQPRGSAAAGAAAEQAAPADRHVEEGAPITAADAGAQPEAEDQNDTRAEPAPREGR